MTKTKADRRTERTRQLLRQALMELMLEKRYNRITVQNIIDRANVGRSTFYMHYQGKQDLLLSGFEHLFVLLGQQPLTGHAQGRLVIPMVELFGHAKAQQGLYEALVWGGSLDLILKAGQKVLSGALEENLASALPADCTPAVPLRVVSNYLAGGLLNLLRWWLDNKMPYSPEQMDEMRRRRPDRSLRPVWSRLVVFFRPCGQT